MIPALTRLQRSFYRWMLAAVALLIVIGWLLADYYESVFWQQELASQSTSAVRLKASVENLLSSSASHVQRLQLLANDELDIARRDEEIDSHPELQPFYVDNQIAGYSLDVAKHENRNFIYGNILLSEYPSANSLNSKAIFDELRVMFALFPAMRVMHANDDSVLWSFYQSMRFPGYNFYPFKAASSVVSEAGFTQFSELLNSYTTPARIAEIQAQFSSSNAPHWRGAHMDGAGGGWIASVAAPVRYQGALWGIVAADIRLQFISQFLQQQTDEKMRVLIVDENDNLVADSQVIQFDQNGPLLDESVSAFFSEPRTEQQWHASSHYYVQWQSLNAAPWHMVFIMDASPVNANVWALLWPLLLVLTSALLIFVVAVLWLRRWIVSPALYMADCVQNETEMDRTADYPAAWRASVDQYNALLKHRTALVKALKSEQQSLELRVHKRTTTLQQINKEMESFSFAVSHDLRAPLRAVSGFAQALADEQEHLSDDGRHSVQRIQLAIKKMEELIECLLELSRIDRSTMQLTPVNLSDMAADILQTLQQQSPERVVQWQVTPDITVTGDARLLRVLLDNLLGNAWKYSQKKNNAQIRFDCELCGDEVVYRVTDNGAGFDMQYAARLFAPFQRLHSASEFEGTGIGLATAQRVVRRHGGRLWAEAEVGQGARFLFTLHSESI